MRRKMHPDVNTYGPMAHKCFKLHHLLILSLALVFIIQSSAYSFITTTEEGVCSADKESSQECTETTKALPDKTVQKSPESERITQKSPAAHKLPAREKQPKKTASLITETVTRLHIRFKRAL